MRGLFYISVLFFLQNCVPGYYVSQFKLDESGTPGQLKYEDDTLSVRFYFVSEGIVIDFVNKSDSAIRIDWDGFKVTENETEIKIVHVQTKEGTFYQLHPPFVAAPDTRFYNLVVNVNDMYYVKDFGEDALRIRDRYVGRYDKKTKDSLQGLIGRKIVVTLPYEFRNSSHTKLFHFSLVNIKYAKTLLVPM